MHPTCHKPKYESSFCPKPSPSVVSSGSSGGSIHFLGRSRDSPLITTFPLSMWSLSTVSADPTLLRKGLSPQHKAITQVLINSHLEACHTLLNGISDGHLVTLKSSQLSAFYQMSIPAKKLPVGLCCLLTTVDKAQASCLWESLWSASGSLPAFFPPWHFHSTHFSQLPIKLLALFGGPCPSTPPQPLSRHHLLQEIPPHHVLCFQKTKYFSLCFPHNVITCLCLFPLN